MEGTITNLNESGDLGELLLHVDAENIASNSTEIVETKTDVLCEEEVLKETEDSTDNADHPPKDKEEDQGDGDDTTGLDEDEYEVERILGVKIDEGMLKFEVRWKGYGSDEDSWEPEENLETARLILDEYIASNIEKVNKMKQSLESRNKKRNGNRSKKRGNSWAAPRSSRRSSRRSVSDSKMKATDSDSSNDKSDRTKKREREHQDSGEENSSNESENSDDGFVASARSRKKKKKTIEHNKVTRGSSRRAEEPISKEPRPLNPKYAWLYDDAEDVELDDDSERKSGSKKESTADEDRMTPMNKGRSKRSSLRNGQSASKESDQNSSHHSINTDKRVKGKREAITSEVKNMTPDLSESGCVNDRKEDEQFEIAGVLKLECGSVKVLCRKSGDAMSELVSVQEMVERDALKFVNYLLSRGVFSQNSNE